ncbi:TlyA family RNA methyltransferase [Myxococcus sp. CA051A]|uniref:TlyA family RNA methyltransferase n=1 Tax=Myxococcus llanfairpwllgwyngyllgogerychwyrndrobwllllantysiliogogogochensis TaxID=2590453 RepID=A0A540WL60_9BACT|nr:TlyA family RNA methyltransferase [Myxococcus llanfairpwllgwyngyllgogerychwyrndrobwllllantysiliogogogochensis]NTX01595.1 TlyA family RNA methyltransferase [Myxococcus sp. CA040A]NTX16235.1 TlyA family RNA methyltransferase [Myxococcus sp. CA056]NTX40150.1 TlyA family RNA methyltransferase [Myxococcus sp. CA033]NTX63014.1 TlyA family RNA methyltransferase [Myxococcus sp. CA051A]TQF09763.1 TlyA family RNA methyltransferase [Myxococcus llanfairpwllgwyngyllgogerychwyrndrobwllllantysiliogogogoch
MKPRKERVDVLVVERGLAESRTKAQALILAGLVVVDDQRVDKPGSLIPVEAELRLKGEVLPYVSRGGLKLKGAIDRFGLDVRGKVAADIGASTGGFTDCLLQHGAVRVHAIDVGYGQLHEKLRKDDRVRSRERVNARYLTDEDLPEKVGVIVIDVSFISLTQVLPSVLRFLEPGGLLAALVKPQFEVGPDRVGKGGVVRDAAARQDAIDTVTAFVREQGLTVRGLMDSPVPGPAGNVEALLVAERP